MKKTLLPLLVSAWACAAQAATITVDSTDDNLTATTPGATCTLRGAVEAINTAGTDTYGCAGSVTGNYGDTDTIKFAPELAGKTVGVSMAASDGGGIGIRRDLVIEGLLDVSGKPNITLDGNDSNRIFRMMEGSADLSITGVRFIRGNADDNVGGAIMAGPSLTLENCAFDESRANNGGAVSAWGAVIIHNSTFSGNKATIEGGAVWASTATTIHNSIFIGNKADGSGGGAAAAGTVTIHNSTFSGNETIAGDGGAVIAGTATISNSTFSGNEARLSGGAVNANSLDARHLTLLGNSAGNSGQALYVYDTSGTTLHNSIIIGNNGNPQCASESNDVFAGSHNLEGWVASSGDALTDTATCGMTHVSATGVNLRNIIKSALVNNGGPTPTLALPPNSPAIKAADSSASQMLEIDFTATPPTSSWVDATLDQRGYERSAIDLGRDLGAYEDRRMPPLGSGVQPLGNGVPPSASGTPIPALPVPLLLMLAAAVGAAATVRQRRR